MRPGDLRRAYLRSSERLTMPGPMHGMRNELILARMVAALDCFRGRRIDYRLKIEVWNVAEPFHDALMRNGLTNQQAVDMMAAPFRKG